jgi:hypothetical protein
MRSLSIALWATLAAALFAGCSGNMAQSGSSSSASAALPQNISRMAHHRERPHWAFPANLVDNGSAVRPRAFYRQTLAKLTKPNTGSGLSKGIYVNEFYGTGPLAYQNKNTGNNPPVCQVPTGATDVNGIDVDANGNLVTPEGANYSDEQVIVIWQGPAMCGPEVGQFDDPYGQPSGASTFDAINGTIIVANIFDLSGAAGSISVCTLSGGCTQNLTNPQMYKVGGVVMDSSGNCYVTSEDTSGVGNLTYFAGCTGSGVAATGFMNTDYGALSFDKAGNLVSVDKAGVQLWVYHGCNPACTLVGGPFPLVGESVFGTVNRQSMTFAANDFTNGQVDVYYYTPTSLTYWYSFNNGMAASLTPEGIQYNPSPKL